MENAGWYFYEQLLHKLNTETQTFLFQHQKSQYFAFSEFDAALEVLIQLLQNAKPVTVKTHDHTSRL